MGLDTSHNCWHGSYSGFAVFRNVVAAAAKPDFITIGLTGGRRPDDYDLIKDYPQRVLYGWWDADFMYEDPLEVFLAHSDCEGWIFPQDAEKLIPRLEEILPNLPGADTEIFDWKPRLQQFIDGLKAAVDEGEIVSFH